MEKEFQNTYINTYLENEGEYLSPLQVANLLVSQKGIQTNFGKKSVFDKQIELLENRGLLGKVFNHVLSSISLRFLGEVPDPEIASRLGGFLYKKITDLPIAKNLPPIQAIDFLYRNLISDYGLSVAGLIELAPTIYSYFASGGIGRFLVMGGGRTLGNLMSKTSIGKNVVQSIPKQVSRIAEDYLSQLFAISAVTSGIQYQRYKQLGIDVPRTKVIEETIKNPITYGLSLLGTGLNAYLIARGLTKQVPEAMLGFGEGKRISLLKEAFMREGYFSPKEPSILTRELFGRDVGAGEFLMNYLKTGNFVYSLKSSADKIIPKIASQVASVPEYTPIANKILGLFRAIGAENVDDYIDAIVYGLPSRAKKFFGENLEKIGEIIKSQRIENFPSVLKEVFLGNRDINFLKGTISKIPSDILGNIEKIDGKNILDFIDNIGEKISFLEKNSQDIMDLVFSLKEKFSSIFGKNVDFDLIRAKAIDDVKKRINEVERMPQPLKEEQSALLGTLESMLSDIKRGQRIPLEFIPQNISEMIIGTITERPDIIKEVIRDPRFSNLITERLRLRREIIEGLDKISKSIINSGIDEKLLSDITREFEKSRSLALYDEALVPKKLSFSERELIKDIGDAVEKNDGLDNLTKTTIGKIHDGLENISNTERQIVNNAANLIEKLKISKHEEKNLLDDVSKFLTNLNGEDEKRLFVTQNLKYIVEPFNFNLLKRAYKERGETGAYDLLLSFKYNKKITKEGKKELVLYSLSSIPEKNIMDREVFNSALLSILSKNDAEIGHSRALLLRVFMNKQFGQQIPDEIKDMVFSIEKSIFDEMKKYYPSLKNSEYNEERYLNMIEFVLNDVSNRRKKLGNIFGDLAIRDNETEIIDGIIKESVNENLYEQDTMFKLLELQKKRIGQMFDIIKKLKTNEEIKIEEGEKINKKILEELKSIADEINNGNLKKDDSKSMEEFTQKISSFIYRIIERIISNKLRKGRISNSQKEELTNELFERFFLKEDKRGVRSVPIEKIWNKFKNETEIDIKSFYKKTKNALNKELDILINNRKREKISSRQKISLEESVYNDTGDGRITYAEIIGKEDDNIQEMINDKRKWGAIEEESSKKLIEEIKSLDNVISDEEKQIIEAFIDYDGNIDKIKEVLEIKDGKVIEEKLAKIGEKLPEEIKEKIKKLLYGTDKETSFNYEDLIE